LINHVVFFSSLTTLEEFVDRQAKRRFQLLVSSTWTTRRSSAPARQVNRATWRRWWTSLQLNNVTHFTKVLYTTALSAIDWTHVESLGE